MRKLITVILSIFILVGCSSHYDEAVELGDESYNSKRFKEALFYYEQAYDEKNDETLKLKIDHIETYLQLVKLFEQQKFVEGESLINTFSDIDVSEPLRQEMTQIKEKFIPYLDDLRLLRAAIKETNILLKENKLEEAKLMIAQIDDHSMTKYVSDEFTKLQERAAEKERIIEEQQRIKAEEENRIAEREAAKMEAEIMTKAKEKGEQASDKKAAYLIRFAELDIEDEQAFNNVGASTVQIREMYWERNEAWDVELNDVYWYLMDVFVEGEVIRQEQLQWLADRDAGYDEIWNDPAGGTLLQIEADAFFYEQTKERTKELVNLYME